MTILSRLHAVFVLALFAATLPPPPAPVSPQHRKAAPVCCECGGDCCCPFGECRCDQFARK